MTFTDADLAYMRDALAELLPDTCVIQTVTRTSDGQGGWSETWATASTVKCRVDYLRGYETPTGDAVQPYQQVVITMPHNAVITTESRIVHSGNTYAVKSVGGDKSWIATTRVIAEMI